MSTRLGKLLFPKLGNMPISTITPNLVIKALAPLKERGILLYCINHTLK
ncbi:hypothetical protein [Rodentibacter pneumotropicus]